MNTILIRMDEDLKLPLLDHLLDHIEQGAFLFAYFDRGEFNVVDSYHVPEAEVASHSAFHLHLEDEVRAKVIKRAWDLEASLIEAHSHVRDPAVFSPTDIAGFGEFVPHVRWRLRSRPYAALVFAPSSFDGLAWLEDTGQPRRIDGIRSDSSRPVEWATGLTRMTLFKELE